MGKIWALLISWAIVTIEDPIIGWGIAVLVPIPHIAGGNCFLLETLYLLYRMVITDFILPPGL